VSMGVFVQGIIFAVVQSKGMVSLMILGCEPISQTTMSGTHRVCISLGFVC
jgi:hypothetical protein